MTIQENIIRLINMVSQAERELTAAQTLLNEVLEAVVQESAARDEVATGKEVLRGVEKLKLLHDGICPDCGSALFYLGPRGGMSRNIQCEGCGNKFNVCPPHFAERI